MLYLRITSLHVINDHTHITIRTSQYHYTTTSSLWVPYHLYSITRSWSVPRIFYHSCEESRYIWVRIAHTKPHVCSCFSIRRNGARSVMNNTIYTARLLKGPLLKLYEALHRFDGNKSLVQCHVRKWKCCRSC